MFSYHKVIYQSNNSSQINNLLLITRNQILNNYEDNIYIKNIKIQKKVKIKRKYMVNNYSYVDLPLNNLFLSLNLIVLLLCIFILPF